MDSLNSLYEFIDRAEKNRKYLANVAVNFRTPLRVIEKELSGEEKNSLESIKKNLDQIIAVIYSKSDNKLSAASLGVYKRRIHSLIKDYEEYGKDPSKMASWDRKISIRTPKEKTVKVLSSEKPVDSSTIALPSFDNNEFQAVDLMLTNGKGRIIVPRDFTEDDAKKLKAQIDILANIFS
ncbi:MAG: hypothetical protein WD992_00400 [Candidatus Levyibacteriota bacterium]